MLPMKNLHVLLAAIVMMEPHGNDVFKILSCLQIQQSLVLYGTPTPAIPRLGIQPYVWNTECLAGQRNTNATSYPQSIGLAATFRFVNENRSFTALCASLL